jgi:hypothetical protein
MATVIRSNKLPHNPRVLPPGSGYRLGAMRRALDQINPKTANSSIVPTVQGLALQKRQIALLNQTKNTIDAIKLIADAAEGPDENAQSWAISLLQNNPAFLKALY